MEGRQNQFQHNPLHTARALRLIKDIRFDAQGSKLSCAVETFDIDTLPSYLCLSYTWGAALVGNEDDGSKEVANAKTWELNIMNKEDDGILYIQQNLFEGLCQISKSISADSTQYVWADAVCIDQDNLSERSSQVAMMDSIFSSAEKVVVWLGSDMKDFSTFASFHSEAVASGYRTGKESDFIIHRVDLDAPIFMGFGVTEEQWISYSNFVEKRRWFKRAWVVQEIALARRVEIFCGDQNLSWDNLVAFSFGICYSDIASYLQTLKNTGDDRAVGDDIWRLGLIRELYKHGGPEQGSPDDDVSMREALKIYGATTPGVRRYAFVRFLLSFLRPFDSSDPRDKIYSAIGIINKFLPEGLSPFISPRYDVEVENVYESAATFLLEHLPDLSILSMVEDRSRRKICSLPSWVPDFSSRQAEQSLQAQSIEPYDTSAGLSFSRSWSVDNSVLTVRGATLDTVAELGLSLAATPLQPHESSDQLLLWHLKTLDDALRLCLMLDVNYISGQGRIQALWRTLIADAHLLPVDHGRYFCSSILNGLGEAKVSDLEELKDIAESLTKRLAIFADSQLPEGDILITLDHVEQYVKQRISEPVEWTQEHKTVRERIGLEALEFDGLLNKGGIWRRLYVTTKGYIGLGPQSMEAGDEVWVLCDAKTLYVLRSESKESTTSEGSTVQQDRDKFTLVGETYLHGFMHGEAYKMGLKDHLRFVDLV